MIEAFLSIFKAPGRTLARHAPLLALIVGGGLLMQRQLQYRAGQKEFQRHSADIVQMLRRQIPSTMAGGSAYSLGISNLRLKAVIQGLLPADYDGLLYSLTLVQQHTGADLIFAMNADGDVIISTRYDGDKTATGNNFAFRPYFQMAMNGQAVVYPALGSTTFQRGLYHAAPIYSETDGIIGVVAVKMPFSSIDNLFRHTTDIMSLVSPHGVVFTSTIESWQLQSIEALRRPTPLDGTAHAHPEYASDFFLHRSSPIPLQFHRGGVDWADHRYAVQTYPVPMNDPAGDWTLLVMRDPAVWFPLEQTLLNTLLLLLLYLAVCTTWRARHHYHLSQTKALEETATAAETYRSIFNSTTDALFVHHAQTGKVIEANASARKLYGYTDEDLEKLTLEGEFPYPSAVAQPALKAAMLNRVQIITFQAQSRSGRAFWAQATFRVYTIHGVIRILADVHDITEQRAAHNALTTSKEQLEREVDLRTSQMLQAQKMAAIGKFAERIAHDVTNAMTRISGYADIIRQRPSSPATLENSLKEISSAAHDMCEMSAEVLAFARPVPLKLTPMNLCRIVEGFEAFIRSSAPSNVVVVLHVPKTRLLVNLSPNHIEQALAHLALNSFESMEHGGTLSVSVRRAEPDEVPPAVDNEMAPPGSLALIEITDTGDGFPADHLPHVFDPFFTTKTDSKRRGMGLTSVYIIVNSHHGWVNAMSASDAGGGGVQIWLPLKDGDRGP